MIDNRLLKLLVCPEDKQPLDYLADENLFYNSRLQRIYEVRDGIPVLLIDEARPVDNDEHARLLKLIEIGASVRTGTKENA